VAEMAKLTFFFIPCFAGLATATQVQVQDSALHHVIGHVKKSTADGFVSSLVFKHRLRVCNAYPYEEAMDVYRGVAPHDDLPKGYSPRDAHSMIKLTTDGPMEYTTCRDFLTPMKAGDKFKFMVGNSNAGTFAISDLPNNDAVLFLVIYRHDRLSTAVSFESHVFANLLNAQVAVIDTYKGNVKAKPMIRDAPAKGLATRSETLKFNSVVAVNPGIYQVSLVGKKGKAVANSTLVALNRQSYVILRTGVEPEHGPEYPQALVVYPESDPSALHSMAGHRGAPFALLVMTAASAWTQMW